MQLDIVRYTIWVLKIFFLLIARGWRRAPRVILGPPNISESRATRVKYKSIFSLGGV